MTKGPKIYSRLSKRQIGLVCLFVGLGLIVTFYAVNKDLAVTKGVSTSEFASCVAAGNPVSEDYPRQCSDKTGATYREPLQDVEEPYGQTENRRGKVTKLDIKVYTKGVDGYVEIESAPGITFGAYIGSGGSPDCDRSLVGMARSKEIRVGDMVEVRAKLAGIKSNPGQAVDSIGFYSVCGEGTFIKKLDPSVGDPANNSPVVQYFDGFQPSAITVKSGTYVIIKNGEAVQMASSPHPDHTSNPELNLKKIEANESITFKVTKKGTFTYHNHLSPSHTGSITVE